MVIFMDCWVGPATGIVTTIANSSWSSIHMLFTHNTMKQATHHSQSLPIYHGHRHGPKEVVMQCIFQPNRPLSYHLRAAREENKISWTRTPLELSKYLFPGQFLLVTLIILIWKVGSAVFISEKGAFEQQYVMRRHSKFCGTCGQNWAPLARSFP